MVDDAIVEQLSENTYRERVKDAFNRSKPSGGNIGSPQVHAGSGLSMLSACSDFTISAAHGVTVISVFVQPRWDATVAEELMAKLNGILVVAPDAPEGLGKNAVRWRNSGDDEALADALEANGIFDFLPESSQAST